MIKRVLIGFALAIVVILFLIWLFTGGPRKISGAASGLANSFNIIFWSSTSTGQFRLPWQPADLSLGPDISGIAQDNEGQEAQTPEEELSAAQKEYDAIVKKMRDAKTFGEPSPFRGKVQLAQGDAKASSPGSEHLIVEAMWDNTAPTNVSGWSLQSALTGIRGYISRGANFFILGAINTQGDVYLNPGASAVVTSGYSPLGTSFRENLCSGYLGELRTFTPSLSRNCPPPSESFPLTPENLRTYGDACFDFVQSLPACTFPRTPASISPACHIFLSNNLSYNGCVQNFQHKSDFARDSWRIYLNAGGELWRNTHDIIRLLDAEGRTVDVVSY
ncbi:hypothetical protein A3A39_04390 [Candidatus Kaiserbacteria bacterium RIFCSPLOWO2_01_FULL_54_13]|uniref:LTD domain-containing protein n=1 Tax=Candidatus Kaiserbacteria bacterium RIFCSPLOWO2_01_FULL_54_13 TaxID=1798512 RepID=A0A1F6F1M6_9BACT|nr:MAG: hypothetical protein A3A39_04390 [Candidatus Kaiserbacteria bacterium RIFCSPLOWO2_01_FULL_54_13]